MICRFSGVSYLRCTAGTSRLKDETNKQNEKSEGQSRGEIAVRILNARRMKVWWKVLHDFISCLEQVDAVRCAQLFPDKVGARRVAGCSWVFLGLQESRALGTPLRDNIVHVRKVLAKVLCAPPGCLADERHMVGTGAKPCREL